MGILKSLLQKKNKSLTLKINSDHPCPLVTIVYGTKTGHSQLIAQQAHKYFTQCGLQSECYNMDKYDVGRLPSERHFLVVVSTDDEGKLPPNAQKFYQLLQHKDMPHLLHVKYAICALGDSSYDNFCGAGKKIEKQFQQLKAQAIINRVDCDVDFEKTALQWIQNCYDTIAGIKKEGVTSASPVLKHRDYMSTTLSQRIQINHEDHDQAIFHIELDNTNLQAKYSAGDCIEIIPTNPPQLVDQIIEKLKLNKTHLLKAYNETLETSLLHRFELTKLTRSAIRRYLNVCRNEALSELYAKRDELRSYLNTADVLDLVSHYPANLTEEQFVSFLLPLHSRYYSIASGGIAHPDKIDLTIKTIRFQQKHRQYQGAGSIYMNEGLQKGNTIDFRLVSNSTFHLPQNADTPVILVGVGTGIAPFRAFLQDLDAQNKRQKAWLIWGDKHQSSDFIYQDELLDFYKNGTLAYLNTVFSRDQTEKRYVQHILIENQKRLINWLDNGAHIYLCGNTAMGADVRKTLVSIFEHKKNMSAQEANQHLKYLRDSKIIHEDLY